MIRVYRTQPVSRVVVDVGYFDRICHKHGLETGKEGNAIDKAMETDARSGMHVGMACALRYLCKEIARRDPDHDWSAAQADIFADPARFAEDNQVKRASAEVIISRLLRDVHE